MSMGLTFEWAVVTTARGGDPDLDSDYQGMGFDQPLAEALRECIAIAQDAIVQGGTASIRLVRWCDGERGDEVRFTLGEKARSGGQRRCPARLYRQWNTIGATATVPVAPPIDRPLIDAPHPQKPGFGPFFYHAGTTVYVRTWDEHGNAQDARLAEAENDYAAMLTAHNLLVAAKSLNAVGAWADGRALRPSQIGLGLGGAE